MDGTTDDSAAIATKVAAGGKIRFPYNKTIFLSGPIGGITSFSDIDLNGSQIKIASSNVNFSNGVFHTSNATATYTDNSPTVSIIKGQNWFKYSGFASITKGMIVQLTGSTYTTPYKYGWIGIAESFHNDTIFMSTAADTTFTVANIHGYAGIGKVSIHNGTINANGNTNAIGINLFGVSDGLVDRIIYQGTGSQVGVELLSNFNSIVQNCQIDSCTNVTNSLGYGVSLNGDNVIARLNSVFNCKHDITASSDNYMSRGIWYDQNTVGTHNQQTALGGGINLDMHGNVQGRITHNKIVTQQVTGIQVRGWNVEVGWNEIFIDNSISNATTVKAIYYLDAFRGQLDMHHNKIHIKPGSGANIFWVAFGGVAFTTAYDINVHDNQSDNGQMQIAQALKGFNIEHNFQDADTLTFSGLNATSEISNGKIWNNTYKNRTVSGSTFAINLNNSSPESVEIFGNDLGQYHQTGSLIKLSSTTTGVSSHDNRFLTSAAPVAGTSSGIILDASTGQQNPQWNNYAIDSNGNTTVIAYASAPTASAFFEGKIFLIASGSTTVPNTCQKTGASTWALIPISAAGSTWTRSGNYLFTNNTTDSVGIGKNTPAFPLDVQGSMGETIVNANSAAVLYVMNNGTLRQTVTGGTGLTMEGYKIGATVSASDSVGTLRFFNANAIALSGTIVNGVGFNVAGGTLTGYTNMIGLQVADGIVTGTMKALDLNVANGTNKWNVYAGGTASNYLNGQVRVGTTSDAFAGAPRGLYVATQSRFDSIIDARSAIKYNQTITSAGSYTITADDYDVIFTGSTATWTFPTAAKGRHINLINHGTGAITLGTAVTTANGVTSSSLAAGSSYQLDYDNTNSVWRTIGSGGSGGVAVDVVQSYTSGTTLTQTTGDNIIQLNPSSTQSTLTITTATSSKLAW